MLTQAGSLALMSTLETPRAGTAGAAVVSTGLASGAGFAGPGSAACTLLLEVLCSGKPRNSASPPSAHRPASATATSQEHVRDSRGPYSGGVMFSLTHP